MVNATDAAIAKHAIDDGSTLVTRDLDFADVRRYPPEGTPGIIVLRVADDAVASDITKIVSRFLLALGDLDNMRGRLVIVERDRFRLRPSLS